MRRNKLISKSPRVDVLAGIRMEPTEPPSLVLEHYDEVLRTDSTNAVGLA